MNNIILKSVTASNFGPFKDECYFTTEIDYAKKELLDTNTLEIKENKYNKVSYIYGANGAGKSNFCKALLEIQKILILSPLMASNNSQILEMKPFKDQSGLSMNYFKFAEGLENMPTKFGIEIVMDKIIYNYSFKILNGKVIEEILSKKNKRTEVILKRETSKYDDIVLKSEMSGFKNNISVVKENVLCLSMAAFLNNEFADKLVKAITSIRIINMSSMSGLNNLSEEEYKNEKIDKYLKVLKIADPTVKNIEVSFTEKNVEKQKLEVDDFENRQLVIKNVSVDVTSTHNVFKNKEVTKEVKLPFLKIESNGTIRMLNILPVLINTLETGGILIIDEIENGLHPKLVNLLVSYFYNKDINKLDAQLICTTHNVLLVEKQVRRDQVWIIDKDQYGQSNFKRLSESKMRIGDNLSQKLLKEAFGNIPSID